MPKKLISAAGVVGLALLIVGGSAWVRSTGVAPAANDDPAAQAVAAVEAGETPAPQAEAAQAAEAVAEAAPLEPLPDISAIPKPENQLLEREYTWRQLLGRDSIAPIYEPRFAPADEAPYDDDELVIGVEINGQAKAYAIGPLNGREMVNDTLGGVPILVTW